MIFHRTNFSRCNSCVWFLIMIILKLIYFINCHNIQKPSKRRSVITVWNKLDLSLYCKCVVYDLIAERMDVAAFSGEGFDPKDWINKALRNAEPGQSKVADIIVHRFFFLWCNLHFVLKCLFFILLICMVNPGFNDE